MAVQLNENPIFYFHPIIVSKLEELAKSHVFMFMHIAAVTNGGSSTVKLNISKLSADKNTARRYVRKSLRDLLAAGLIDKVGDRYTIAYALRCEVALAMHRQVTGVVIEYREHSNSNKYSVRLEYGSGKFTDWYTVSIEDYEAWTTEGPLSNFITACPHLDASTKLSLGTLLLSMKSGISLPEKQPNTGNSKQREKSSKPQATTQQYHNTSAMPDSLPDFMKNFYSKAAKKKTSSKPSHSSKEDDDIDTE